MRYLVPGILTLLCGCGLMLGKSYKRFDTVPGGMGVVYIYAGDVMELQSVHVDRDPATDGATHTISMVSKGYYPYLVSPGLVRVLSGPEGALSCVEIAVSVNSQHWVRVTQNEPRVTALPQADAEREIAGHREISRENMAQATGAFPTSNCPLSPL